MKELFRLRIAAKRQITVPQRLMNALGLAEGDEIQIEVRGNQIGDARACKVVPTHLFSSDIVAALEKREQEMQSGRKKRINPTDIATSLKQEAGVG